MFSKDEVENVLNSVKADVKVELDPFSCLVCCCGNGPCSPQAAVRREMEKSCKMGAIVLERVIESAVASGLDVAVDMSRAEDESTAAFVVFSCRDSPLFVCVFVSVSCDEQTWHF